MGHRHPKYIGVGVESKAISNTESIEQATDLKADSDTDSEPDPDVFKRANYPLKTAATNCHKQKSHLT